MKITSRIKLAWYKWRLEALVNRIDVSVFDTSISNKIDELIIKIEDLEERG